MKTRLICPAIIIVAAGLMSVLCSGCSAEAKKKSLLTSADGYFKAGQYEKAEIEYKNVLQAHGLDPVAISRLGMIYFEQGRLAPAFQFLSRGSELQPDNLDLRVKLGLYYFATGRSDEARNAANLVLDKDPKHDEAIMLLAEASQQPKDAAETRNRLNALGNQNSAVLSALGLLELRANKAKEAETLLSRARELDPKFGPANAVLGALYWAQKDFPRAEEMFAAAAAAAPPRSPLKIQHAQFNIQVGQISVARNILEATVKNAPDFIPPRILLATLSAREKNYDEGIVIIEKVLSQDSTHPEALHLAAQIYLAKGDKGKAIAKLEGAVKLYPKAPQTHHHLGVAYAANGETGKAAASFAQAIALPPDFPAPIIALAELNVRQGNFGPAIASLKQLLKQNPSLGEAQLLLATAYRLQGSLSDALAAYQQLSKDFPKNPQAHLYVGIILLQQNKRAEARIALSMAAELAPDDFAVLEQLVMLDLAEKLYEPALQRLSAQIAKAPAQGPLQMLLAKIRLAQSDSDGAEAALRKAIELQPDSLEAYFALVQLYIGKNQNQKALADLQQAASKSPNDIRPPMISAVLHEQQKNFSAARESYERVLAINPKIGVALNNLAYIYSEHLGEMDKALDLAQRAREALPNQSEAADTLGWILYKKRQYQRALPLLEEAATKTPDNAELNYHLGMAHYMLGDELRARIALEKALHLNKKFQGADEAISCLAVLNIDPAKAGAQARGELEATAAKRKDDSIAQSRLGAFYEREGSADKAMAAYAAAQKLGPANMDAALGMIRLLRAKNDTAAAMELAKSTRKLAPTDPRIAHILGRLSYETRDFPASFNLMQDAARQQPNDSDILFDLAESAYSVGRVSDAENALREALEKTPNFAQATKAREFLMVIPLASSPTQAGAAISKIDAMLKANPADIPALMAKAIVAEEKRDLEAAKKFYEKALGRFPDFSPAKKRLAIIYAATGGDNRKAFELAAKAREAFPDDAELARALGIITFRMENYARAASLLQESARTRSSDAELFYYLGMAQHKLKNSAASLRSLKQALELGLPEALSKEANKILNPEK